MKLELDVAAPSPTVRITVAVPVWPAAGVTVTVRLAALPPKVMLALGKSVGLDEEAPRVRLAAAVSTSPTVMASGPTAVPVVVV